MSEELHFNSLEVIGCGPRVSSVSNIAMFQGWLVGEFWYAASEDEVITLIKKHYPEIEIDNKQDTLNRLHQDGVVYWTEWYSLPHDEWWVPPTTQRVLDMIQMWIDTHIEQLWLDNLEDTTQAISEEELSGYIAELRAILNHMKK